MDGNILYRLSEYYTIKEIADKLGLDESIVKNRINLRGTNRHEFIMESRTKRESNLLREERLRREVEERYIAFKEALIEYKIEASLRGRRVYETETTQLSNLYWLSRGELTELSKYYRIKRYYLIRRLKTMRGDK